MRIVTLLLAATAIAGIATGALAQGNRNQGSTYDRAPDGYYSQSDRNGYYDRGGVYRRNGWQVNNVRNNSSNGNYYRQGAYERNCHSGNAAAGTIFGALAGGLLGSAVSHGNGGAVVGGAVLGGVLGNTISRDIDCDDQPYAFQTYSTGLNGDIGRRYEWNHGQARGYFMPTREYRRSGTVCRDFTETTYRNDRELTRTGTSCRAQDGNWRFD
jgi:surface antigen